METPTDIGPIPPPEVEPPIDMAINGDEEIEENDDDDDDEVLRAPEGTPVIVNTTAGRQLIMKYTEDCYIAATLAEDEPTVEASESLLGCLLTMADMRYGGRKESYERLKALQNMEVAGA